METERYRLADVVPVILPGGDLVYDRTIGFFRECPRGESTRSGLDGLKAFRTLDEHARLLALESRLGPLHPDAAVVVPRPIRWALRRFRRYAQAHVEKVPFSASEVEHTRALLQAYVDAGILETESDVRACFDAPSDESRTSTISLVAVPTRNRPDALERALVSYWNNHRRWDRRPQYLVVDSSEEHIGRDNGHRAIALAQRYGIELVYRGARARRDYAARLASRAGVAEEVVSFGLLGLSGARVTTGAARNCVLISTGKRLCLQVDDDSLCRIHSSPNQRPGLAVGGGHESLEYYYTPDQWRAAPESDTDYLALHEALLGRSVASVVSDTAAERLDVSRIGHRLMRGVVNKRAHIVATLTGTAGDSGQHSSFGYLLLNGKSRERLLRSRSIYQQALRSRWVVRSVPQTTIADTPWCVAINLGMDNSKWVPPFMPVYRNQDGLFASLLALTQEDGYFGILPWLVMHEPVEHRQEEPNEMLAFGHVRFADLFLAILRTCAPGTTAVSDVSRHVTIGRNLADIGSLEQDDFNDLARTLLWEAAATRIRLIEETLDEYGGRPRFWATDLLRRQRALKGCFDQTGGWLPRDLVDDAGTEKAPAIARRVVYLYGKLLEAWDHLQLVAQQGPGLMDRDSYEGRL